jgi:hypothetical protein
MGTGLLPEPDRSAIAGLLRSYVGARLDFYYLRDDATQFKSVFLHHTRDMRPQLVLQLLGSIQDDRPVTAGLFIQTLNEVIDLHAARLAAMENHVPESVLLLLILVTVMAAMLVGYGSGLAKRRHLFSTTIVALLIGMVIVVIIDLDRPSRRLIRVSQERMLRLRDSIKDNTR